MPGSTPLAARRSAKQTPPCLYTRVSCRIKLGKRGKFGHCVPRSEFCREAVTGRVTAATPIGTEGDKRGDRSPEVNCPPPNVAAVRVLSIAGRYGGLLSSTVPPPGNSRQGPTRGPIAETRIGPLDDRKLLCRLVYVRLCSEKQRAGRGEEVVRGQRDARAHGQRNVAAGGALCRPSVASARRQRGKRGRERPPSSGSPPDPLA